MRRNILEVVYRRNWVRRSSEVRVEERRLVSLARGGLGSGEGLQGYNCV